MHDFAHRTFESALLALAACSLAGPLRAQDPVAPRFGDVDAIAVRALDARDPTTRGEAALWLADSGKLEHYQAILTTAEDKAAPARHRAILAVGRLGAPGAEAFLGRILHDAPPDAADAALAAFALGALSDQVPTPAIDGLLERVQGGSRRRNLPLLTSLLGGLASREHPARVTALRGLRDDEVNRDEVVPLLAQAALGRSGVPLDAPQRERWLASDSARMRTAALETWLRDGKLPQEAKARVSRLARTDRDATVRATALHILAHHLDEGVLGLADRALHGRDAVEVGAAARILLGLAGEARRGEIEDLARAPSTSPAIRVALLDALGRGVSGRTLMDCAERTRDARVPTQVRVASALLLARAESALAESTLLDLFHTLAEPEAIAAIARELHQSGQLPLAATRLTTPDAASTPTALAAHVEGVARVDAVLGTELLLALVEAERLREASLGLGLGALRRARVVAISPALLALVPEAVAALSP
ncbi:MAG: hypothetical protein R3F56_15825 [Planctomycetota bacterium]